MPDILNKKQLGQAMEQKACDLLLAKGLYLITKNYYCPFGEIDLIMQDGNEIVFIEVRFRTHSDYGNAIESINYTKQQKLLKSATHYLQKNGLIDNIDCRFDVIGFSNSKIEWIKDAFSYE